MKKINRLLHGELPNNIFPFFWQHGEDEATLRDYMRAIYESNIRSVCVECRPHPDFCGPKWWQDMDVILDETRKRGMQVWILDDDHFPTGHANGGIENTDISLRPWYVDSVTADCYGPSPKNRFNIREAVLNKVKPKNMPGMPPQRAGSQKLFFENDEEILSITAWELDHNGALVNGKDISSYVTDGLLTWDVPNGAYRICVTFLTHNGDGRTDYINILDHDSVRVLIDEVYEKHYEKYADEFGRTIRGFFSDEPMVGNIAGMYSTGKLGGARHLTNPWQKNLPDLLNERLGENWKMLLPLLWEEGSIRETVAVRTAYMDAVTRLIEKNFAGQLGEWCEAHGVEYIGHAWEDKHLSYALGGGLGHYFRALHGNHMGGVDVVFNSQMRPWSHHDPKNSMGGDFYYYTLGKLASSIAHIDPKKEERALCEIFGATGWDFGIDKMKYISDNMLVSGINRYVPHAFSPKAFPDPDCPPHFYAHGENAQFKAFGRLMLYLQRTSELISSGKANPEAAILYTAENDWVSELSSVHHNMYCSVPAKLLSEAQIDYDILPSDVLTEESLKEGKLNVNGYRYKALVVPSTDHLSEGFVRFTHEALKQGFPVFFLDSLPSFETLTASMKASGTVVSKVNLIRELKALGLGEVKLSQASSDLRVLHYTAEDDIYLFVNNNTGTPYEGTVTLPNAKKAWIYDAYENTVSPADQVIKGEESLLNVCIKAYNPLLLILSDEAPVKVTDTVKNAPEPKQTISLGGFSLSSCFSKNYPAFIEKTTLEKLTDISVSYPDMMDCYRYETDFELQESGKVLLTLEYCSDPVEVTVNGVNCGMQISPDWIFDLTEAVRPGRNTLQIDVFATPARKVEKFYPPEGPVFSMDSPRTIRPEGIIGDVNLKIY